MKKSESQSISLKRIVVLCLVLANIPLLCFLDYKRLSVDFISLKSLLSNIRFESASTKQKLIVKFQGTQVLILQFYSGKLVKNVNISTLKTINYDTKLGKNMIVFDRGTTDTFNVREHGGEITLKSWLGFKKNIHINCAGLVREGKYPN